MTYRKLILIISGSFFIASLVFAITLAVVGKGWTISAKVTECYICKGSDPITGKSLGKINRMSKDTPYLCLLAVMSKQMDGRPCS
jgi:hypothetical protein